MSFMRFFGFGVRRFDGAHAAWQSLIFASLFILAGIAGGKAMATEQGLGEWVGFYYADLDTLRINKNGHFELESAEFGGGGDSSIRAPGAGTAMYEDGKIILRFDTMYISSRKYRLDHPYPFIAIATPEFRLLLDEAALINYINAANGYGSYDKELRDLLHRVEGIDDKKPPVPGKPLSLGELRDLLSHSSTRKIDPAFGKKIRLRDWLPEPYASLLLEQPLKGKIVQVGPVTQEEVSFGDWQRPPETRTQFTSRVTVNLGTRDKVFTGMQLFVGSWRYRIVVERVDADSCELLYRWVNEEGKPTIGMDVSSSQRR